MFIIEFITSFLLSALLFIVISNTLFDKIPLTFLFYKIDAIKIKAQLIIVDLLTIGLPIGLIFLAVYLFEFHITKSVITGIVLSFILFFPPFVHNEIQEVKNFTNRNKYLFKNKLFADKIMSNEFDKKVEYLSVYGKNKVKIAIMELNSEIKNNIEDDIYDEFFNEL